MGKQFSFSMDMEDEYLFRKYLQENGYYVYQDNRDGEPSIIDNYPENVSNKGGIILYLYKPDFGEITFKKSTKGKLYIDATYAPVIEFVRTIVRNETKKIHYGRIWVEMKYYDKNEELFKKNEELDIEFKKMKKWISKLLNKVDINSKDCTNMKSYISKSLAELIDEKGYKFE